MTRDETNVLNRLYDGLASFDTVFSVVGYAQRTKSLDETVRDDAAKLCDELHVCLTGLIKLINKLEALR